ncbi:MAG: hypothetical protein K2K17_07170, partial [Lachnospiraceae bacterium]|nr:hypothetical protein [Lachnospiraceae bacterium]
MDQKKTEKVIFMICGVLGVVFLAVFGVFLIRMGKSSERSTEMAEQVGEPSVTEGGEMSASTGSAAQEIILQNGNGENGQDAGIADLTESGSDVSASEGAPVVFTSNASQSTEGDWLFVEGNRIVDASGK